MISLIVEDDDTSRMVLQRYLMPYGETHTASNGADAVAAFADSLVRGNPFDLICLDIMLPGMSGQQVLEEIRAMEDQIDPASRQDGPRDHDHRPQRQGQHHEGAAAVRCLPGETGPEK